VGRDGPAGIRGFQQVEQLTPDKAGTPILPTRVIFLMLSLVPPCEQIKLTTSQTTASCGIHWVSHSPWVTHMCDPGGEITERMNEKSAFFLHGAGGGEGGLCPCLLEGGWRSRGLDSARCRHREQSRAFPPPTPRDERESPSHPLAGTAGLCGSLTYIMSHPAPSLDSQGRHRCPRLQRLGAPAA